MFVATLVATLLATLVATLVAMRLATLVATRLATRLATRRVGASTRTRRMHPSPPKARLLELERHAGISGLLPGCGAFACRVVPWQPQEGLHPPQSDERFGGKFAKAHKVLPHEHAQNIEQGERRVCAIDAQPARAGGGDAIRAVE